MKKTTIFFCLVWTIVAIFAIYLGINFIYADCPELQTIPSEKLFSLYASASVLTAGSFVGLKKLTD